MDYHNCDEIKEKAKIYRKETNRPLTSYQKKMNLAAQELCLQNPALLLNKRTVLIEEA